ncbi:MAG: chorismate-binding protein, partial [Acidobacteria bacterium]|nr:chorismate-binding protein [Acidobacteriota bacterium]
SCIAIRTMLEMPEQARSGMDAMAMRRASGRLRAFLQAGAGIVADSDPESEYRECRNKARAAFRAVEMARKGE